VINKLERTIKALTIAMEKPEIANALIQRVINELNKNNSGPSLYIAWDNGELKHSLAGEPNTDFEWTALYAVPLKKEWVGLTDEEVMSLLPGAVRLPPGWADTVRAIEAKLEEKNT
jgi:hypothetical protein